MHLLKILKKAAAAMGVGVMLCALTITSANAAKDSDIPVDIEINGSYIQCDTSSYIQNGCTFSPLRTLSNALGADVEWNEKDGKITITNNSVKIEVYNNSSIAYVNGNKIDMGRNARIINGVSFIPVRFLSENLGGNVSWDNNYFTVRIQKNNHEVADHLKKHSYYEDNIFWLARIVEAESSGEPLEGKVAVGNVVLNRVKHPNYPNSIYDVIFDRNFGVQFQPVLNGSIYNVPSKDSIIAAKRAIMGEDIVGSCLYFLNPTISTSSWIVNNRKYYGTIQNHDFYL